MHYADHACVLDVCQGKKYGNADGYYKSLANVTFVPEFGIPITCYPYCGLANKKEYSPPFVMATFHGVKNYTGKWDRNDDPGTNILVECVAWAKNMGAHGYEQHYDMIGSTVWSFKLMYGAAKGSNAATSLAASLTLWLWCLALFELFFAL
jgi:hypothetical protein